MVCFGSCCVHNRELESPNPASQRTFTREEWAVAASAPNPSCLGQREGFQPGIITRVNTPDTRKGLCWACGSLFPLYLWLVPRSSRWCPETSSTTILLHRNTLTCVMIVSHGYTYVCNGLKGTHLCVTVSHEHTYMCDDFTGAHLCVTVSHGHTYVRDGLTWTHLCVWRPHRDTRVLRPHRDTLMCVMVSRMKTHLAHKHEHP